MRLRTVAQGIARPGAHDHARGQRCRAPVRSHVSGGGQPAQPVQGRPLRFRRAVEGAGPVYATTGRHPLAGRVREIDTQYGRLAAALGERGVELVNLSSISRLASLPRARPAADGGWTQTEQRSEPMKVAGEPRSRGAVGPLLEALTDTARKLGYKVARDPAHPAPGTISIVWNGRYHRRGAPTLYCEH